MDHYRHLVKLSCKYHFNFPISSLGAQNHFLVLGGDPKPKQKEKEVKYLARIGRDIFIIFFLSSFFFFNLLLN